MNTISCGIDFGTTNSAISVASKSFAPRLVPLDNNKQTIPTAIFFEEGCLNPLFGNPAIEGYISGLRGRFMRSLKRILGTDLMSTTTLINDNNVLFEDILTAFIKHLKTQAEANTGQNIDSVVMGRPVYFRDNDPKGNLQAEKELRQIASSAGFKNIDFQLEPIAAAYAHEENISTEKLACVIDIGGGTSDFSIIKLCKSFQNKPSRSDDILACTGIRIGGNDFDKDLSIESFMPLLGLGTTFGTKNIPVPLADFFDLSEWSKINSLYNYKRIRQIKNTLNDAKDFTKYSRLLEVVETEQGHNLLDKVERAKIALTDEENVEISLDFLGGKPIVTTNKKAFETAITKDVAKTSRAIEDCLKQAGVSANKIELIILTGGSTEIPFVQKSFCSFFPNAEISQENKLSSVGLGLAFDSLRKF